MDMARVGVRTRARAALATSPAQLSPKRRKLNRTNHNQHPDFSRSRSGGHAVKQETTVVLPDPVSETLCSSPTYDEFPASCCSSNGSVGFDEERIKVLDLEVESGQVETSTCNCGEEIERREMSHSSKVRENSQEVESVETNSRRPITRAQNMPTELELEEFFATAEKGIQKRFQDKYNYDIVNDVPLEGRYDWVQLKP